MKNIIETELPNSVSNNKLHRVLFDAFMHGKYGNYRILFDHQAKKVILSFESEECATAFTLAEDDKNFNEKFFKQYQSEERNSRDAVDKSDFYRHMFETKLGGRYDAYK